MLWLQTAGSRLFISCKGTAARGKLQLPPPGKLQLPPPAHPLSRSAPAAACRTDPFIASRYYYDILADDDTPVVADQRAAVSEVVGTPNKLRFTTVAADGQTDFYQGRRYRVVVRATTGQGQEFSSTVGQSNLAGLGERPMPSVQGRGLATAAGWPVRIRIRCWVAAVQACPHSLRRTCSTQQ